MGTITVFSKYSEKGFGITTDLQSALHGILPDGGKGVGEVGSVRLQYTLGTYDCRRIIADQCTQHTPSPATVLQMLYFHVMAYLCYVILMCVVKLC